MAVAVKKIKTNNNKKIAIYSISMKSEIGDFIEIVDRTEKLYSTKTRKGNRISLNGLGQDYQSR